MPRTIEHPPFPDIEALTGLITDLAGQVQSLREEVAATKAAQPTFSQIIPDYIDRHEFTASLAPGQDRVGDRSRLLVGADSHVVPFKPRFDKGSRVRINPDSTRKGAPKSWGDILSATNCSGYGIVRFVSFMSASGEWKYKVEVPGLTSAKRLDGFYDSELLPA